MIDKDFTKEIQEIRDRLIKTETTLDTVIKQQEAIDTLANSVQELALSMRELTVNHTNINTRLCSIEKEKGAKSMYIWTALMGILFGALSSIIYSNF